MHDVATGKANIKVLLSSCNSDTERIQTHFREETSAYIYHPPRSSLPKRSFFIYCLPQGGFSTLEITTKTITGIFAIDC